jgi:Cytochrome c554 and c-prime
VSSTCAKIMLGGLLLMVPQVLEPYPAKAPQETLNSARDVSKPDPFVPQSERSPLVTGRQNYVGDEACRACHLEKAQNYWKTAHHLSSRLPTKDSILGSFAEGKNIFRTSNPALYFRMDSKADGFYQSSFLGNPPGTRSRTERFDVVIGSGRVGQTYLFWKDDYLFQLPVSYWVDLDSWINSPGYRDGVEKFDRPVAPRCLECHLTYAEAQASSGQENKYKPGSLVLGISCERCHGPGRQHVDAMTSSNKGAPAILNLTKLTRERQIDICAQCHGGRRIPMTVPFSYTPGEPLDNSYSRVAMDPGAMVDVHGNQVALLQMSRCYQSSSDLVCSTCHDVHQPQRDAAGFSTYCLKCHRPQACGEFPRLKEKITGDCINCHMPVQSSNLIISNSNGKKVRAMVRSHWIKIYPSAQNP